MTRQQRRAAEREAIKASVHQRVQSALSVQQMWRAYGEVMAVSLGCSLTDDMMEPLRQAFYAGSASMFELVARVAPDEVSEDRGVAVLSRIYDELRTFAKGLR
jgi:hypothetical protein